jgi:predicted neuraminidase
MKSSMVFSGNDRFPTSHSSSICELPNGELLVAWFAGMREGSPDSVILTSRLYQDEMTWDKPEVVVDVYQHAAGNPRLFIGPDEGLWLISPINYGQWCAGGTKLFLKRSYDLGHTWTDLEIFIEQKGILGKNKPISLNEDVWILPVEYENLGDIAFLRTKNAGKDWQLIDCESDGIYLDQPCIAELDNGELLSLIRSWEGYIYETRSTDNGLSWSKPVPTKLNNPNSGIDVINVKNQKLVLAYNPTALGTEGNLTSSDAPGERTPIHENQRALAKAGSYELDRMIDKKDPTIEVHEGGYFPWGPRSPLSLATSADNGRSWKESVTLENDPGEFSYPSIILGNNKTIHITYTYQRTGIKYVCMKIEEV